MRWINSCQLIQHVDQALRRALADADGNLPEPVVRLGNPALVDAVCNEVLDGDQTAWDDIAGQVGLCLGLEC